MPVRNCDTCAHARHILQGGSGALQMVCARNTPTAYVVPMPGGRGVSLMSMFPPVTESMGCSEHKPEKPD